MTQLGLFTILLIYLHDRIISLSCEVSVPKNNLASPLDFIFINVHVSVHLCISVLRLPILVLFLQFYNFKMDFVIVSLVWNLNRSYSAILATLQITSYALGV
jgi:hypothetical protein